jgi:hypothetical protein
MMGLFDAFGQIGDAFAKIGELQLLQRGQELFFSLTPVEQSDILTFWLSHYQKERGFDWSKEMNVTGLLENPEFAEESWHQFGSKMTTDWLERIEKDSNGIEIFESQSSEDLSALTNFLSLEYDSEESVLNVLISMNPDIVSSMSYTIGTSYYIEPVPESRPIGSGGKSKAEQIKEIKELLDSGAINEAEFKQMKQEVLKI